MDVVVSLKTQTEGTLIKLLNDWSQNFPLLKNNSANDTLLKYSIRKSITETVNVEMSNKFNEV